MGDNIMHTSNFVIDQATESYLRGEKISNGEFFPVIGRGGVRSRNDWLKELTASKKIIHLGCGDHIDLIELKRKNGSYLHDILVENCSRVVGIDPNREALERMALLGIEDLYHPDEFKLLEEFDYMLVTDVIEHINNIGEFLSSIKSYNVTKWVFTTPNGYRLHNRTQFSSEHINTDHRYWFSPYTLVKTLYENGFYIEKVNMTDTINWRNPVTSFLKWRYPLCRDGIAVVAYL
jgi:2-polyprenyl-3-methyl-5-hydroxy-6-metoxy-1,4-benzoquinol methylase